MRGPFMPRPVRPAIRLFAILVAALVAAAEPSEAQSIRLRFDGTPLQEAIRQFERITGESVVFANRLVAGFTARCAYDGDEPAAGLACLLEGTGLTARRSGVRQFVLSARRSRGALAGFVRDRHTGEPLPGAHVVLPDLGIGAATSSAGFFSFPSLPEGRHRLRVSFVGFATVDTTLATGPDPRTVSLHGQIFVARNVLVESSGERADLGLVPGLVSVPVRRLQQLPASLGGQDLLEALKWLPGISRTSEVTGGLVVRGSGPDQNLYLVDGAPVYHPWHAFSLVSTFETESFRQIRLYRGSFPAEFGGRLSAVLDAELADGRRPEPRAVASVGALAARFLIESPVTPRISFMLAGRRSYLDQIIGREHPVADDAGRRDTLRTGYYFYDWSAKVAFRPDKDSRATASYYVAGDDLDLRLPFDLSLDRSSWLRPTDLVFEIAESWENELLSLRYERLLRANWFITTTGYAARYRANEGAFVQPSLAADVRSRYGVRLNDVGAGVDVDYYRSLAHQLRMGLSVAHRSFDSDVAATIHYAPGVVDRLVESSAADALEASAYAQDLWRPAPPVQVVWGVRAGFFGDGLHVRISPRLSAQLTIHPTLFVAQAAVSRNSQFLHRLRDRYSFLYDLVSSRWVPSSGTVPPADGTQVALGAESRPVPGVELRAGAYLRRASGVLLPLDVFRTKDGLAGPGIEVGTLLGQYAAGDERSAGIELEATYDRRGWLATTAYTMSKSESRSGADPPWRPSRYDLPHVLDLVVRRQDPRWGAGLAFSWRSGYPVTVPVARYELVDPTGGPATGYLHRPAVNNGRLPPYVRLDVDFSYRWTGLGAEWLARLQLYNALGRRNVVSRSFVAEGLGMRSDDRLGLPIIPLFELRVEL